ncbi:MAG TPA: thioredoxin domain-containing protein [Pyrinomonadaceae bacterium]|jgi:protein-disulfide isomerase
MKRTLPFIIILAVLGVALGSAWYMTRSASQPTAPAASTTSGVANNQAQPAPLKGVPGAEPPYTLGSPNAPAHLEEFGDYQCPPCGMFHPILQQMHKEFGDKLQITFREFPLTPAHQHALAAASAAEAAGLQGRFWEMHDLIYEHQNDWKDKFDVRPIFEGYAKDIGLDVERYKRDIGSEVVAQRIFLDGKRGHSLGVKGTPTVFLNGREVPFEALPADSLRVLIQREINNAGNR